VDDLLTSTSAGLYCSAGDFHIDPCRPVATAVLTHAHRDHTRTGCGRYLAAREGAALVRSRLGAGAKMEALEYGEPRRLGRVWLSLHPAGHIRGSAQARLEAGHQVTVVSGDFKRDHDPTCSGFEIVPCETFVCESTFGLPIYRWGDSRRVLADIQAWWCRNQQAGRASLLYAYALGKAQRLLASLDASVGPIYTHGAVESVNAVYRASGVDLPPTRVAASAPRGTDWTQALILAPPSAHTTPWARRFGRANTAIVSGWMRVRGMRRRRAVDRGFALSDHADWPGLLETIAATRAKRIKTMHGYARILARYLRDQGWDARSIEPPDRSRLENAESGGESVPGEP
jgi:putative mRNA 3-end processing factor